MTDRELDQIMLVLDNVWGGVDEGREAGYRWVLGAYPAGVVQAVVVEMACEDREWLPKAPEIAARVCRELAAVDTTVTLARRLQQIQIENRAVLEAETNPIGGNDDKP